MKNVCVGVLTILSALIGAGFLSGAEIVVFFSRFGRFSFLGVFVCVVLVGVVVNVILNNSEKIIDILKNNRFLNFLNLFVCLVFSSSMCGGFNNLLKFDNLIFEIIKILIFIFISFLFFKNNLKILNKLILFLFPIFLTIFLSLILNKIDFKINLNTNYQSVSLTIVYSLLYGFLNLSSSTVVIAGVGKRATKKQKALISFISALVLFAVLFFANIVLLSSGKMFVSMPFLQIFVGRERRVLKAIILFGFFTTFFTLLSSNKTLCKMNIQNQHLIFFISFVLPFSISILGFSKTVTFLYPLAGVCGVVEVLVVIALLFKKPNKKIHSACQNAK